MPDAKGYYSVIQYCPDPARAEVVNIGVVLLCPELDFAQAMTRRDNHRVERMFGRESFDYRRLNAAKQAIEHRVKRMATEGIDSLEHFISTRANDLLLTPARSMRVVDGDAEAALEALHEELVGHVERGKRSPTIPRLDDAMRRPIMQGRVEFDQTVTVPVMGRTLRGLYTYQNGRLNLVKPQVFKTTPIETASLLATQGRLIHEHPDPEVGERQLIVVSEVQTRDAPDDLRGRISELLNEFNTRVVWPEQIDDFAAEVEAQAHS